MVVVPRGQASLAWMSVVALLAMALMAWTGARYSAMRSAQVAETKTHVAGMSAPIPTGWPVLMAMTVLIVLLLSFLYLVVGAFGVIVGGMVGDRVGRRRVIWISILGSLPFAVLLPYVDLFWTGVLSVLIGFIMASAFSSILIYAIDLVPHRVGLVGGLFYGMAFGLGGLTAAALGLLADQIGIIAVFKLCSWLPALGLLTFLLPRSLSDR
jgi:FSR family fosmidomycin resistance protein-like MFS transporter